MITGMPRIAIATGDFSGIVDTFRNKLGMPVIDLSARTVPALGARIAMCVPKGGSNIELMSPQDPAAPLCQSLQRFLDRRGQGLFALMLEAPRPECRGRSARHARTERAAADGGRGRPRTSGPNSTRGTLIRVYPVNSFEGEPPAATPVGPLSGVRRVIVAVRDLDDAAAVYGERLGLAADHAVVDPDRGVAFVRVRPPAGGVIELVAVRDRARPFAAAVTAHLDANPEGMYALVLQANDPVAMLDELRAKGLDARAAADSPDAVEIGRGSMFGALVRIERDQAAAARR